LFGANNHGLIEEDGAVVRYRNSGTGTLHLMSHDGNEDITLDASGFIQFEAAGNIEARIDGDGLKFNGDTAAANALDDYEEGTFTPTFLNVSTTTYDLRWGIYTKIGNTVFFQLAVGVSNWDNSDSSSINISGLPFAIQTDHHAPFTTIAEKGVNVADVVNIGYDQQVYMLPHSFSASTGNNLSQIQYSTCGTNMRFRVEGHYQV
jgi:hypothetical protein